MPDLSFQIEEASMVAFAATPMLAFRLKIRNSSAGETIHSISLHSQIQIDTVQRRYAPEEQESLRDLFGESGRWNQTLRSLLWTHANLVVPGFEGAQTTIDLQVPCTFDFNVAITKYFEGLKGGEIPLCFLFSGTVFYALEEGALQIAPISWEQEAKFHLPLKVWRQMMDSYYPNSVWISLRRDVFDRLHQYKVRRGIPTWEQALESLFSEEEVVKQ